MQLYHRYNQLLFSLILAIVHDYATAEEVTLDVFLRVWQQSSSYNAEKAMVSTWLIHIARHSAIDILRRQSTRPDQSAIHADELLVDREPDQQDPQVLAEQALRDQNLHTAIAQLPTEQREVLILAYFEEYSQQQIAARLGLPLGTVKTRTRLAIKKLYDCLAQASWV